jgi:hypothetical protein
MKSKLRTGLALCGLMVTLVVSAGAQSPSKAKIPFDFNVGDMTLKAGEYTIKSATASVPPMLVIVDADSRPQAIVNCIRIEAVENNGHRRLLFTRYGDHYFLSQIWLSETEAGASVRKGRLERELAMESSQKAQQVTLALVK